MDQNTELVLKSLKERGIQTHMLKQDISDASMREMLMFTIQLITNLPNFVPKSSPFIF